MTPSSTDLDRRIERVERRLVAREARVLGELHAARTRLREAAQPPRWLLPMAGAAVLAVAWRLLSHRRSVLPAGRRFGGIGATLMAAAPLLLRFIDRRWLSAPTARVLERPPAVEHDARSRPR